MDEPRRLEDTLDAPFLRRQQGAQRILWLLMVGIVTAALLGLLGTSPFATEIVRVHEGDAWFELEKPRFTRYEHAERMHLRVFAPSASGDELDVTLSDAFVLNHAVTDVTPAADGGGLGAEGALYTFRVEDWSKPLVMSWSYEPRKSFRVDGALTVAAGGLPPVTLSATQFVYP